MLLATLKFGSRTTFVEMFSAFLYNQHRKVPFAMDTTAAPVIETFSNRQNLNRN